MNPYLTVSEVEKYCHEPIDITLGVLAEECREQIKETRERLENLAQ